MLHIKAPFWLFENSRLIFQGHALPTRADQQHTGAWKEGKRGLLSPTTFLFPGQTQFQNKACKRREKHGTLSRLPIAKLAALMAG